MSLKLGGLYFVEKYDKHFSAKRHLHYVCSNQEMANLTLNYDTWCIGWVLYELTTRGHIENATFTCTSPTTYLANKDLNGNLNPKYKDDFNLILKE